MPVGSADVAAELPELVSLVADGRLDLGEVVSHVGGDEFAAIVVDVDDASELELLVDDLCRAVRASPVDAAGPIPVTVSVGAALSTTPGTPEALLAEADTALYAAKADGRGCGRVAGVAVGREP